MALPLHSEVRLLAQRGRWLVRHSDQAPAEARRLPIRRRPPSGHQPLPRRSQRRRQTIPMDRRSRQNHRRCQTWAPSVRYDPLVCPPNAKRWPSDRRRSNVIPEPFRDRRLERRLRQFALYPERRRLSRPMGGEGGEVSRRDARDGRRRDRFGLRRRRRAIGSISSTPEAARRASRSSSTAATG